MMIGMVMKGKRSGGVSWRGDRGLKARMNHIGSRKDKSEGGQQKSMRQQGEKLQSLTCGESLISRHGKYQKYH